MNHAAVDVVIFDTTLRDGAQALPESNQFPKGSKPEIAAEIARLGVAVIEAGFPATPGDAQEVRAVAQSVGQAKYRVQRWDNQESDTEQVFFTPIIAGLSRALPSDIEATWSAICGARYPRIHTFIATDPDHMQAKFPGKTAEEVLSMGSDAVRFARILADSHPGASVEFSAEAASTTDEPYLERIVKAMVKSGADVVNVPDTVGQRDPVWMQAFYTKVIQWVMTESPSATISAHNHNDLGQSVANSIVLVHAAAAFAHEHNTRVKIQIEGTFCGLGERAGNADLFAVAGGLFKFTPTMAVPINWQFNPGKSVHAAQKVMSHAGLEVPRQAPIIGSDTMVHRSGIHSDGIIKGGHRIYTPHDPKFWGHDSDAVHQDGRYQGKRGRAAMKVDA